MKKQIILTFIASACSLMVFQGCTSSNVNAGEIGLRHTLKGKVTTIKVYNVRLSPQGRIYVGDKYTGLKKMVKQLKTEGANTNDRIAISIPANTSQKALTAIGRELATNGFGYIHFEQKNESATVKDHR